MPDSSVSEGSPPAPSGGSLRATPSAWPDDFDHLASRYPWYREGSPHRFHHTVADLLKGAPGGQPRIDPAGALEMVATAQLLGDRTLVEGVRRAPWRAKPGAGGNWEFAPLPPHGTIQANPEEVAERLRQALLEEVRGYVSGRKSVGILLSGGMDSRIAGGILRQLQLNGDYDGSVLALTWGLADSRDVVYGREIADRFGWEWMHLPLTAEGLLENVRIAGVMGAEFAPFHLHAMPAVAALDGLDAVIAGSYGDSVGRAEFSGMRVRELRPFPQEPLNRFGLLRQRVERRFRPQVFDDAWGYRSRLHRSHEYEYREVEQQMHYMRRKLQAPMNLIAQRRPLHQLFTAPAVFGAMWSLDPRVRTDGPYGELIVRLPGRLHEVPWARTGRRFGEVGPPLDDHARRHHRYEKWLRQDLRAEVLELVRGGEIARLGIFNPVALEGMLRLWSRSADHTMNAVDERIAWLASLAVFAKEYGIQPAAEGEGPQVGDLLNGMKWSAAAALYQSGAYRAYRRRRG